MLRWSGLVIGVTLLGGCGGTVTPGYIGYTELINDKGQHTVLFGFDANRRGQLARLNNMGELVDACAEPPPDTASTLAAKAAVEASGKASTAAGVSGEGAVAVNTETTQAVTELGKRTAETMFLRELLFRRCEARMNARAIPLWRPEAEKKAQGQATPNPHWTSDGYVTADSIKAFKDLSAEQIKAVVGADDAFFTAAIEGYKAVVATNERAERVRLVRELQGKMPSEWLKDKTLVERFAAAVDDPSKVGPVYERIAEILREEEKKKAELAAAEKALEDEVRGKCEGLGCEAAVRAAEYDASTKTLKFKKADLNYVAPANGKGHILEKADVKITLAADAWNVVTFGDFRVAGKK